MVENNDDLDFIDDEDGLGNRPLVRVEKMKAIKRAKMLEQNKLGNEPEFVPPGFIWFLNAISEIKDTDGGIKVVREKLWSGDLTGVSIDIFPVPDSDWPRAVQR